jgi:hypothetical protein
VFCPKCGASNADGATFCSSCGASLTNAAPSTPAAPPTSSHREALTSSPTGGASAKVSGIFNEAIALTKNPADYMRRNKDHVVPVQSLIINYVAILAAIPLVATLIGDLWYYSRYGAGFAVEAAIATYILEVLGVIIIGIVIWKLGPSFETKTDQAKATMLAAYIYTPFFLISIVDIIPPIALITFLGTLYGLYILYLGLPIVLGTPSSKVVPYLFVILVAAIIVFAIIALIIGDVTQAARVSNLNSFTIPTPPTSG